MFKLAFTSCMSTSHYPSGQTVWTEISKHRPDALLLLGDSVYIDSPPKPDQNGNPHPSRLGYRDEDFANHLHDLYARQLAVSEFRRLLDQLQGATYAIWDDHDFLWNDANGEMARQKNHRGQTILSANLLSCWREAIARKQSFPATPHDARVYQGYEPPIRVADMEKRLPGYSVQKILSNVFLHLTDGRSWRMNGSLLGEPQRQQIEKVFQANDKALHIVASGSTWGSRGSNGWRHFKADSDWLTRCAATYNILMLSGDIHRCEAPEPLVCGTKKLLEATASGAAVNFNPLGLRQEDGKGGFLDYSGNYGLLDISEQVVKFRWYCYGKQILPVVTHSLPL